MRIIKIMQKGYHTQIFQRVNLVNQKRIAGYFITLINWTP